MWGKYRRIPVAISDSDFVSPEPYQIPEKMRQLIKWSETHRFSLHPIFYAALLYERFMTIHPFVNENGHAVCLLLNFAMTVTGYPPIVVKADPESRSRLRYNRSLEEVQIRGEYIFQ